MSLLRTYYCNCSSMIMNNKNIYKFRYIPVKPKKSTILHLFHLFLKNLSQEEAIRISYKIKAYNFMPIFFAMYRPQGLLVEISITFYGAALSQFYNCGPCCGWHMNNLLVNQLKCFQLLQNRSSTNIGRLFYKKIQLSMLYRRGQSSDRQNFDNACGECFLSQMKTRSSLTRAVECRESGVQIRFGPTLCRRAPKANCVVGQNCVTR